jgi:hypothetical protein
LIEKQFQLHTCSAYLDGMVSSSPRQANRSPRWLIHAKMSPPGFPQGLNRCKRSEKLKSNLTILLAWDDNWIQASGGNPAFILNADCSILMHFMIKAKLSVPTHHLSLFRVLWRLNFISPLAYPSPFFNLHIDLL